MKRIIQIIPYRRLIPDGVGDYGSMIATEWKAQNGTETVFLAATPKDFEGECPDGHETHYLEMKTPDTLVAKLESLITSGGDVSILLHVSAYGYQKRGLPYWLLRGIGMFRKKYSSITILSVFHELTVTPDLPFKRSFWLARLQKPVVKGFLGLSDVVITPCEDYAEDLCELDKEDKKSVTALPVFSTVGDGVNLSREHKAVKLALFGGRWYRHNIFSTYYDSLLDTAERLGVSEIVDIGMKDARFPEKVGSIPVRSTGMLPADEVSRELSQCDYGVLSYTPLYIGKCTVFACFAAHSLGVICFDQGVEIREGLTNGEHLIISTGRLTNAQIHSLKASGTSLHNWYKHHSLQAQIPVFESLIV